MHYCSERMMITKIWSLCLIFFLSNSILVSASPAKHLCLPDQGDALWEFKNEFYVPRLDSDLMMFESKTGKWRNNTDCCSWDGVSCDPKTGKVVELDLMDSHLNGPLRSNSSLFRLQHLQSLVLSYNNIWGTLPDSIGNLKYLEILSFRGCNLFGKIPSSLGSLSYLGYLFLWDNDFTNEQPDSMGDLNQLTDLVLTNKGSDMKLVGSAFKIYKTIDVSGNRLQGDIPESIGILKELIVLNMSNNAFTGHIPPCLSNLSNLQSLDLSKNRLSGGIPTELGKLTFLEWMNFSYNRLEGPIPQGTQIQSQNISSFVENPGLCGTPLRKKCGREEEEATKRKQDEDEEKEEKDQVLSWIAAAVAYVPGVFCGVTIAHILTS